MKSASPEALSGIKVGLTKGGFPFQKLSQDHPSITLVIIKDDLDGIGKLLKGDIDALATNRLTGQYQIQKHGAQGIVPVAWTLASKEIAIALRKEIRPC
ncbi:MAG: transporter substrate-binding domain-containing protein [Candidatus Sedimenticola sp. (ex Thyasira tokunagai)]